MRLLWLADVLRAAGLTVHEVVGWRERGSATYNPVGIICHATAGSSTSTDAGEISVLLNGSNSAPPPIAQLYLSRSGAWHVVASGRCNHARTGQPGTPLVGVGNSGLIGVEAQNNNAGQPWPAVQLDAYQRGVAAICKRMGWSASRAIAHREHQPNGKTDPVGINMGAFRATVAALITRPTGGYSMADSQLIANAERAATALVAGTEVIKFDHPWNDQAKAGFPNPLARLERKVDALTAKVGSPVDGEVLEAEPIDLDALADKVAARLGDAFANAVADKLAARLAS